MEKNKQFKPKYSRAREEDKQYISIKSTITTKETIRIGIDQTLEIKGFHLVVGYNVSEITQTNQGMKKDYRNDLRRGRFRSN